MSKKALYEIESILDERIHNNKRQFYIKRLGRSYGENIWVDEEDILSNDKIVEYENSKRGKHMNTRFSQSIDNGWANEIKYINKTYYYNRTLMVEYVLSYKDWKGVIEAKKLHYKAPYLLLEFYEKKLLEKYLSK